MSPSEPWPRLLLIADGFTDPSVAARIEEAVAGGVRWVQLRDHHADSATYAQAAETLASRLRALTPTLRLSTNRHPAVAHRLGGGTHLGAHGPSVAAVRDQFATVFPVGYSAHTREEAARALQAGAHYVTLSPIFATRSKPGQPGVGLETLAAWVQALTPAPVFALGGITPDRAASCLKVGVAGVAVLSGILHADDPSEAVRAYLHALHAA